MIYLDNTLVSDAVLQTAVGARIRVSLCSSGLDATHRHGTVPARPVWFPAGSEPSGWKVLWTGDTTLTRAFLDREDALALDLPRKFP